MSDFNSLYAEGEATDYAADATPVENEEVGTIQENLTQVMGDAVLSNQPDALAAETTQDVPEPPSPQGMTGQDGPNPVPTNENMGNTPDPLEDFMVAHSEDFRDVSSMKLADYEAWLFQSEEGAGELAVARIVSNFKASGYEVKPTYAAVAGATWSRMNYANEEHKDALKRVERASVAELQPPVVEIESEGVTSLIETVRRAESQAEDFRAEMITQIKTEMAAEAELTTKNAESQLNSENWSKSIKEYMKPAALIGTTLLGFGLMKWWK
jgi:hypothetical protein